MHRGVVFISTAGLILSTQLAAQGGYSVIDLGPIDNLYSVAVAINEASQVAGHHRLFEPGSPDPFEQLSLFLPAPAFGLPAGFNALGSPGGPGAFAFPAGINAGGRIVGRYELDPDGPAGGPYNGFFWQDGTFTPLPPVTAGFTGSWGNALNDAGEAVGHEISADGCQPLLWLPAPAYGLPAGANVLPVPAGETSALATGINALGEIVGGTLPHSGWCDNSLGSPDVPLIWLPAAAYGLPAGRSEIPLTNVDRALPKAISNQGHVVGTFWRENLGAVTGGFLWHNGVTTIIRSPGVGLIDVASDVNDAGEVVGFDGFGSNSAFLWRNGVSTRLSNLVAPDAGWSFDTAWGINNRGEIVGGGTFDGTTHAFRLVPPDPIFADGFETGDTSAWSAEVP